jgi:hypothetical protein
MVALSLQTADVFHASKQATHKIVALREDRALQSKAVSTVLENTAWTGRVTKKVDFPDLESQRLLDYLLLQHGAKYFSAVHSAR